MSLFRLPNTEPLAEYDPALASRLATVLVETLQQELAPPEPEALRLANEVVWTVTRERDGMWLNLAGGSGVIRAGGGPRRDEKGLTLYVRQTACSLAGRDEDFERWWPHRAAGRVVTQSSCSRPWRRAAT